MRLKVFIEENGISKLLAFRQDRDTGPKEIVFLLIQIYCSLSSAKVYTYSAVSQIVSHDLY